MFFRSLAIVASLFVLPDIASASVFRIDFTGEVESINDGANANLPGGLPPYQVGQTLSGRFSLDTSLMTGGVGTAAFYAGAASNLSVTIAGNTYVDTGPGTASMRNDDMAGSAAPLRDMFLASFGVTGPDAGGEAVSLFQFSLGGTDAYAAGALSGVDAPTASELLALFNNDNNNGNTKFLSFVDSKNGGFSDVRYDVTGLRVSEVPLPASMLLLLAGNAGLLALRRRRRRAA